METVTVSPKFQVVIPKALRERMKLKPGQKLLVYEVNGRVFLEPARPISELFGIAKGMKWREDYRDRSDRY